MDPDARRRLREPSDRLCGLAGWDVVRSAKQAQLVNAQPAAPGKPMRARIFWIEVGFLVLLSALLVVYKTDHAFRAALPSLGPLPIQIVWFGATGGVLAGLSGVFFHNQNWNTGYNYWHYSRPLIGGVAGGIGALLYYVAILLGSTESRDAKRASLRRSRKVHGELETVRSKGRHRARRRTYRIGTSADESPRSARRRPPANLPERWDRMLSFGGDEPDRKSASFRLMGPLLDPDAVTLETGLIPESSHRKGDPHVGVHGRQYPPWPSGLWSLSSEHALPALGNHLDDHLAWLLDQLEPHADVLRRICAEQQLRTDFYCGYAMGQANSGIELSGPTLTRIAVLGLGTSVGIEIWGEEADRELEYWLKDATERGDSSYVAATGSAASTVDAHHLRPPCAVGTFSALRADAMRLRTRGS